VWATVIDTIATDTTVVRGGKDQVPFQCVMRRILTLMANRINDDGNPAHYSKVASHQAWNSWNKPAVKDPPRNAEPMGSRHPELAKKCVTLAVKEYEYEICHFEHITQVPAHHNPSPLNGIINYNDFKCDSFVKSSDQSAETELGGTMVGRKLGRLEGKR